MEVVKVIILLLRPKRPFLSFMLLNFKIHNTMRSLKRWQNSSFILTSHWQNNKNAHSAVKKDIILYDFLTPSQQIKIEHG